MIEYLVIALIVAVVWFWRSERAAAEAASALGLQACQHAQVQWLDQNVQLLKRRIKRHPNGQLGWERRYSFEFSIDGLNRQSGLIVLHGLRLHSLLGPDASADRSLRDLN